MRQECVKQKVILRKGLLEKHFEGLLKLTRLQLFLTVLPSYGSCIGQGTVVHFVNNYKKYIFNKFHESDVYLVFDRYRDYSTKSLTREGRASDASRLY